MSVETSCTVANVVLWENLSQNTAHVPRPFFCLFVCLIDIWVFAALYGKTIFPPPTILVRQAGHDLVSISKPLGGSSVSIQPVFYFTPMLVRFCGVHPTMSWKLMDRLRGWNNGMFWYSWHTHPPLRPRQNTWSAGRRFHSTTWCGSVFNNLCDVLEGQIRLLRDWCILYIFCTCLSVINSIVWHRPPVDPSFYCLRGIKIWSAVTQLVLEEVHLSRKWMPSDAIQRNKSVQLWIEFLLKIFFGGPHLGVTMDHVGIPLCWIHQWYRLWQKKVHLVTNENAWACKSFLSLYSPPPSYFGVNFCIPNYFYISTKCCLCHCTLEGISRQANFCWV